jgi:NAD(P)-dependent dehydrogenase (short-subunit alcohol dehydrogenase family)
MPAALRFDGRVAVVTGAGRGLGRAHARLLAERGARVVVNDLGTQHHTGGGASAVPADEVVEEIRAAGGEAVPDHSDISMPEGARTLVGRATDEFGRIDIVVNNAGIMGNKLFAEISPADYDAMLDTHAGGSFNVTSQAWPHMIEQGYGRIVMICSGAALFGVPLQSTYAAAKGAVIGLTRGLTVEAKELGDIKVNAVAPAAYTRMAANAPDPVTRARMEQQMRPEQVAPVVAWLAHEDCTSEGQVFYAGGGWVGRVFFAQGPGYAKDDLTLEDVATHWADVCREDGYVVPETGPAAVAWALRHTTG